MPDFFRAFLDDLSSNPKAYLPPRSSLWLWIGGPLLMLLVYFLTTRSTSERRKRLRAAELWRASIGPERSADEAGAAHTYRPDPKQEQKAPKKPPAPPPPGPPRVLSIPSTLDAALHAAGGGKAIAHYELVKDLAYVSLMEADPLAGSDYQAVTAKLEAPAPEIRIRPLPPAESGQPVNAGVQFRKDPAFMAVFLVEGDNAKAIGKWLTPPLRRALCELPNAWVRVSGTTMTVSAFGSLEADKLDELVELADAIFAEHGAEGGPSLFGDGEEEPAAPKASDTPKASKAGAKGEAKASDKKKPPATATTMSETPSSKKRA